MAWALYGECHCIAFCLLAYHAEANGEAAILLLGRALQKMRCGARSSIHFPLSRRDEMQQLAHEAELGLVVAP